MDANTLNAIFIKSTMHVLDVMAQTSVQAGKPFTKKGSVALGDYTAFICANCEATQGKGSIAVTFTKNGAICVAKNMLGEDVDDEQSLKEVVGELVNIISGDARRHMASLGVTFDGSTPTMLDGKGHNIQHDTKALITVIPFKLSQGEFVVEFGFEI